VAEENHTVSLKYEIWDGDKEMVIVEPSADQAFRSDLFTDDEIESLNTVLEKFRKTKTRQLVEISHNEAGWKDNFKEKKLISYKYAFDLLGLG
jgi:uncharacterized phage-associated protein